MFSPDSINNIILVCSVYSYIVTRLDFDGVFELAVDYMNVASAWIQRLVKNPK